MMQRCTEIDWIFNSREATPLRKLKPPKSRQSRRWPSFCAIEPQNWTITTRPNELTMHNGRATKGILWFCLPEKLCLHSCNAFKPHCHHTPFGWRDNQTTAFFMCFPVNCCFLHPRSSWNWCVLNYSFLLNPPLFLSFSLPHTHTLYLLCEMQNERRWFGLCKSNTD